MDERRDGLILLDIPLGTDEHFDESFLEIWTHEPNVAELDGLAARVEATDR